MASVACTSAVSTSFASLSATKISRTEFAGASLPSLHRGAARVSCNFKKTVTKTPYGEELVFGIGQGALRKFLHYCSFASQIALIVSLATLTLESVSRKLPSDLVNGFSF